MEPVNVRNLEQIQEEDRSARSSRLGALLLASLGGAALVTVALVMAKRTGPPARAEHDPLAELVKSAKNTSTPAEQLDGHDVTFPGILSDSRTPTTALAAVKDGRGRLVEQPSVDPAAVPSAPPPASDRLPVVPLPVGTLLSATPVTTEPKDSLTAMAHSASALADGAELASSGMEGGYQLQVASYRDQADADRPAQARPPRISPSRLRPGTRAVATRAHRAVQKQVRSR
jgi:DedD protein